MLSSAAHWDRVFTRKAPNEVSWYRPHLDLSLELIQHYAPVRSATIVDVGAGESTLVDDLLANGYEDLTIVDISEAAIQSTRKRLGHSGQGVHWVAGDITSISLPSQAFDIWHDRAVFHFLTDFEQRRRYVRRVVEAVRLGGHVIVSTFGPNGPTKCSGLNVMRYDAESLHEEFGRRFRMEQSAQELHRTPWGSAQQFVYCCCKLE